jgi:hypothetical protein
LLLVPLAACATAPETPLAPLPTGAPPTSTTAARQAGSGNGVGDLPAARIMARAKAALLAAHTVRLVGYVAEDGELSAVDMRIKVGHGSVGFVKINSHQVDLIRIGSVLYVRADEVFWVAFGVSPATAAALGGKYIRLLVGRSKDANDLATMTDLAALVQDLFPTNSMIIKGRHRTIRGVEAVGITAVNDRSDTIYVALTGQPVPMQVVPRGKTADFSMNFVDYNKPVTLAPPPVAQVVDAGVLPG